MATHRQARSLLTLGVVLGLHLLVVWLIVSSPLRTTKPDSDSLQLFSIAGPPPIPESGPIPPAAKTSASRRRSNRIPALPPAPQPEVQDNAIHPDWAQELELVAKNAVTQELARRQHDADFSHAFPTQPKRPPEFAWNYAGTHRVETLPHGGILIHLGDNCVLLLIPLPMVGCAIGKAPANGDLFKH